MDRSYDGHDRQRSFRLLRQLHRLREASSRARGASSATSARAFRRGSAATSPYTELCEKAREDAYELLLQHAGERGANAIIGVRYDANEVSDGITEVLAYGTAVVVEPEQR